MLKIMNYGEATGEVCYYAVRDDIKCTVLKRSFVLSGLPPLFDIFEDWNYWKRLNIHPVFQATVFLNFIEVTKTSNVHLLHIKGCSATH